MEATARSPGRFARRTRSATAAATSSERSSTKSTPERLAVAAHCSGMPLEAMPNEKNSSRPPPGSGTATGARASSASRPAPAAGRPAAASASRVSARPARPKSRTWLLASAHASGRAAARQGRLAGFMR